jgi:hypothetical protein
MRKHLIAVWILCGLLMTAGCSTSYYRVTDPDAGKSYYTHKVEEAGKGGAVKFKDAQSGDSVTVQSSEVKELSEDEFIAGLAANQTPRSSVETTPQTRH